MCPCLCSYELASAPQGLKVLYGRGSGVCGTTALWLAKRPPYAMECAPLPGDVLEPTTACPCDAPWCAVESFLWIALVMRRGFGAQQPLKWVSESVVIRHKKQTTRSLSSCSAFCVFYTPSLTYLPPPQSQQMLSRTGRQGGFVDGRVERCMCKQKNSMHSSYN